MVGKMKGPQEQCPSCREDHMRESASICPPDDRKCPPLPGRELDALVAEKVMGHGKSFSYLHPDGIRIGWDPCLPAYSTDANAALEVVKTVVDRFKCEMHLRNEIRETPLGWDHSGRVTVQFGDIAGAYSDSAPHAICLAALKAVGAII